jgi:hypothetical protein
MPIFLSAGGEGLHHARGEAYLETNERYCATETNMPPRTDVSTSAVTMAIEKTSDRPRAKSAIGHEQ